MDKRQFTGKTLDDALSEAARAFSTDKDLLCYNVIQQPTGGILSRLFSRSVKIEAWVETVKQDLQAAAREVVRQTLGKSNTTKNNLSPVGKVKKETHMFSEPKTVERKTERQNISSNTQSDYPPRTFLNMESEGVQELFENYNQLFFSAFGISQDQVEIIVQENEAVVKVVDSEIEKYLSKSDKLSLAFEHVFKRIAQKKLGDISSRITVEAGDSSEKREERLIGMAKSLAEKVKKTGKSVILSSKSSQERRIIHLALDGMAGIATRSVGTGDKRRLVIYSTEKKPRNHANNLPKNQEKNFPNSSNQSRYKKKIPKKRNSNFSIQDKQNTERVGAVSSIDNSKDDQDELPHTHQKHL
ncbi:R3H domain-containing nucleic acid-binding protein [Pigmentibacter sp. JX0631]|uniref:Jag family protein n=1 Tax=Pigmentibacter sp. JX0631 TaxID=2976982 RepID=UPI002469BC06|nr:R3H domain-containing nucleic acid-binding protein [Pigmentibacter sp. JX0631]WGL60101.1 R3H domain-containing nucleic acid-binding protein [Pigmentibacter sp. JX0631]